MTDYVSSRSAPIQHTASESNDIMNAFKDVELPNQISQMPAVGWWFLAALICLSLSIIVYGLIKKWRINQAKRYAIKHVKNVSTAQALNTLLKRAALSYFPRKSVARLSGEDWLNFLLAQIPVKHHNKVSKPIASLLDNLYAPAQYQTLTPEHKKAAIIWLTYALPKSIPNTTQNNHSSASSLDQKALPTYSVSMDKRAY